MGPLVYTSGRSRRFSPLVNTSVASMGPLVYTSGSVQPLHDPRLWHPASMGPLVYTSGSMALYIDGALAAESFNGAAGLHQR